jgi:alpha-L-fucosidase
MGRVAPKRWKERYLLRIKDLIDQHKPDMLYTDGGIPFEGYGLSTVGELYNVSAASHSGHSEAVYYSKVESDCAGGTCVLDRERGVLDGIWSDPWQTDTCIGDWHYKKGIQYKSGKRVIDLLVDIVSKNGNLLLNFPLPADGELDSEERKVLDAITDWMSINSEGIYGSQPWKVYGEGPAIEIKAGAGMNESTRPDLTASDFRFTRKGGNLYVFVQGWPGSECIVKSLGAANELAPGKIAAVDLLGGQEHLSFRQEDSALRVNFRGTRPTASSIGITLRISFA